MKSSDGRRDEFSVVAWRLTGIQHSGWGGGGIIPPARNGEWECSGEWFCASLWRHHEATLAHRSQTSGGDVDCYKWVEVGEGVLFFSRSLYHSYYIYHSLCNVLSLSWSSCHSTVLSFVLSFFLYIILCYIHPFVRLSIHCYFVLSIHLPVVLCLWLKVSIQFESVQ